MVTAKTFAARSNSNCTHSVWLLRAAMCRAVMPPSAALLTILPKALQERQQTQNINQYGTSEITDYGKLRLTNQ